MLPEDNEDCKVYISKVMSQVCRLVDGELAEFGVPDKCELRNDNSYGHINLLDFSVYPSIRRSGGEDHLWWIVARSSGGHLAERQMGKDRLIEYMVRTARLNQKKSKDCSGPPCKCGLQYAQQVLTALAEIPYTIEDNHG